MYDFFLKFYCMMGSNVTAIESGVGGGGITNVCLLLVVDALYVDHNLCGVY